MRTRSRRQPKSPSSAANQAAPPSGTSVGGSLTVMRWLRATSERMTSRPLKNVTLTSWTGLPDAVPRPEWLVDSL